MEIKRNDIFLIAFGLVMLILISCKPKPEVSFDVDSFHKSLEEIASGVIEWTSDLEEEQKDTLNVGDKFECDRALSDSVVLREMKGYLGNDDIDRVIIRVAVQSRKSKHAIFLFAHPYIPHSLVKGIW